MSKKMILMILVPALFILIGFVSNTKSDEYKKPVTVKIVKDNKEVLTEAEKAARREARKAERIRRYHEQQEMRAQAARMYEEKLAKEREEYEELQRWCRDELSDEERASSILCD